MFTVHFAYYTRPYCAVLGIVGSWDGRKEGVQRTHKMLPAGWYICDFFFFLGGWVWMERGGGWSRKGVVGLYVLRAVGIDGWKVEWEGV